MKNPFEQIFPKKDPDDYRPDFEDAKENLRTKSRRLGIAKAMDKHMPDGKDHSREYKWLGRDIAGAQSRLDGIMASNQKEGNKLNDEYNKLLEQARIAQEKLRNFELNELGMEPTEEETKKENLDLAA